MTNQKNLPKQQRTTAVAAPKTKEDAVALMTPVSERYDPQKEAQNAALIGFELEVASVKVDRFGWTSLDDRMKQRLTDDWTQVLRPFPIAEVKRGINDCLEANPRKCPSEHEVKAAIQARRKKAVDALPAAHQEPEPSNVRKISPEGMAEVQKLVEEKFPSLRKSH